MNRAIALRHAMYYGVILGVVISLHFYLSTFNASVLCNFVAMLLMVLAPILAYRFAVDCRERVYEGTINYGSALWYGVQLFFYAALIAAAFRFVFFKYIDPDYLQNTLDTALPVLEKLNYAPSEAELSELRKMFTPVNMALNYIWADVIIGFFVSLITGALVQRSVPKNNSEN